jgi:ABC-type transporter MlaC component
MKKIIFILTLALLSLLVFPSCEKKSKAERLIEDVKEDAEDVSEDIEDESKEAEKDGKKTKKKIKDLLN